MHLFLRIVKKVKVFNFLIHIWCLFINFFTNCYSRTIENYLNYIISNEKIYAGDEFWVICLIKNVWSRMTRSHYGFRNCRQSRELNKIYFFWTKNKLEICEGGFYFIFCIYSITYRANLRLEVMGNGTDQEFPF